MKFKNLMYFKNTDPNPDLRIKKSGFGSGYPGYPSFGAYLDRVSDRTQILDNKSQAYYKVTPNSLTCIY